MTTPTLDSRPAGFRLRWPPAGATTVTLRAPGGQLEGRELRMWVQPKSLTVPDLEQATATATISAVSTEEVGDVEFDVAVATFADVGELTQSTWYRVLIADGDDVWCNGLVKTSNDGTDEQSTTLSVAVASGTIELAITVAPAGPGASSGLPAGSAGQMFRVGEDGETVEAVSPNAPGAWLRLNGSGHVPDVHLSADIVRESEMASAISAAIDDLVGGAPGALDTLNELAAALGDDEAFAATVTNALATKVTQAEVAAAIAAGAVVKAVMTVDVLAEDFGGVYDGDGLTVAAAAGSETGTWLFRNQTSGANVDLWTHDGDGGYIRQDPGLALARQGTLVVSQNTLTAAMAEEFEPQVFRVTGANQLEELVVTEAQIQALIDATVAPLVEAQAAGDHDALTAAMWALDPPAAWFVFDDTNLGTDHWRTSDIPELTTVPPEGEEETFVPGLDLRVLFWWTRGSERFNEIATRNYDDGEGDEDSPEFAKDNQGADQPPESYAESVRGGEEIDETDVTVVSDTEGVWAEERYIVALDGSITAIQRRVRWGGDVATADGYRWRTLAANERPAGLEVNVGQPWRAGLRFNGRIARWRHFDGIDGTMTADLWAEDVEPGATSVVDRCGRSWTTEDGVVQLSPVTRIAALETAPAPITVVESLGPQTAITNSGTWPGPLHTAVALPTGAPGDLIEFDATVESINNAGAVRRPTITLTVGSTTITPPAHATTLASGTTRQFVISGRIHVLSPTSQRISFTAVAENYDALVGTGAATEDMSTSKNLTFNAGSNSATGTQSAQLLDLHIRKLTA